MIPVSAATCPNIARTRHRHPSPLCSAVAGLTSDPITTHAIDCTDGNKMGYDQLKDLMCAVDTSVVRILQPMYVCGADTATNVRAAWRC
jgi:hypothetical protein